ncbi:right-handed parallel beta-helix repeat-containing protein [Anaerolineae bacterium CFX7]|nr:right-handed parallel beta-helix repeat-containing protein [Anaerolineae bacterium CFX7]
MSTHFHKSYLLILLVPLLMLGWFHAAASNQPNAPAPVAASASYDIGTPVLSDLWVNPVSGNDNNSGATRAQALRTINAAWNRIPRGTTLNTTGYRILLVAGDYAASNFPAYWEERYGAFNFPILLQAADAPRSARLHGNINMYDTRYFYLLDVTIVNAGDAFHCELCNHILIRNSALDGGARQAQETVKVNQSQHIYIEDSDIAGAWDNAIDFVAVQYGAITRNRIHNADDWCAYAKGGSAYLRVEGNEIYDCGTGGFTLGQGTGLEFMTNPWLHYEAYDLKFVNNLVHDIEGACFGVNGAYNALLAYNTCYRVGARSHVIEVVFGSHACDGDTARCNANRAAGGWGNASQTEQPIPDRNVLIYNNLIYNPPGTASQWQHFAIYGPRTPSAGTNIPSPARTDTNLQIRGNLIWNGDSNMPLGIEDPSEGCQPANPTCNETQLRADNAINTVEPQLVNPAGGNFHPTTGSNILGVTTFALPDFSWSDAPAPPSVPVGVLSNAVPIDRDGGARVGLGPPGAYAYPSAPPTVTPTITAGATLTPTATPTAPNECLQKPSAPALDAPANGAQPNRRRVVLTWQTSACANEYRVQVRADSRRGARVVNVVGLTASSFTTPRLARGHTYFWRVKACNSYGCAKSAWRTFAL